MPNTLTVQTWDLVLPRPSWVLVTNPDRQLPCHFSKTVLRIPSIVRNSILFPPKNRPRRLRTGNKKETPATAKNHCDKSLKRTHDIGCFHRADAAMQCTAPGLRHTPYSLLSVLLYAMSRRSVNGLRRFFCRFFSGEFLSNAPHCPLSGSVPAPGQPPGCGSISVSWRGRGLSGTPNRRSGGTGGRWRR